MTTLNSLEEIKLAEKLIEYILGQTWLDLHAQEVRQMQLL